MAPYLASDIINSAMILIGAIAAGETPSTEEQTDALLVLNDLLASWDNERLNIYSLSYTTPTITSGKNNYVIGLATGFTATWNQPRPVAIKSAVMISSTGLQFPVKLISAEEWTAIPEKGAQGAIVRELYNDGAYPNSTISLWPTPTFTGTGTNYLGIYSWVQFTQLAIGDTFDLPPGYQRAIRYNLAVDLLPEYPRPMDQSILASLVAIAASSKAALNPVNLPPYAGASAEAMAAAQVARQIGPGGQG